MYALVIWTAPSQPPTNTHTHTHTFCYNKRKHTGKTSFILIMDKLNKRCNALCAGYGAVAVSSKLSVALCASYGAVAVGHTLCCALCRFCVYTLSGFAGARTAAWSWRPSWSSHCRGWTWTATSLTTCTRRGAVELVVTCTIWLLLLCITGQGESVMAGFCNSCLMSLVKKINQSETRMTASILKQDPNT